MRDFCSPVLGGERSTTQRHPLLTGRHFRALTAFDSHQRRVNEAGLKRAGSRRPARDKATAAATVERIDRVIQRLSVSFQIEETGELEYPAELERLRRQRDIYAAEAADEPDPAERAGLMERWRPPTLDVLDDDSRLSWPVGPSPRSRPASGRPLAVVIGQPLSSFCFFISIP